ncbi:LuxR C-terminal-related transcriptional regulator [Rhodococcus maanshanensis]|uniref:ATP-binding protein n=1 Tax=Rhodococcus maanshanensis TaxID=183556 RepID=UPI0022B3341E|nr:LuxR C-terminal-related transcriptional regulator [Rhodococcus maanshanensis]MCZ4555270.1 LuxR C-terminal-related transcriptional regulator [Rhodococcus maanshanensis]
MASAVRGKVGNLPLELTSFVGRRREVTETRRLLSVSRLVTLTGIGGVGKTRLALRVAEDSRRSFEDGVWLVELGELREEALLPDLVAATLGLREQSTNRTQDSLAKYLADRRLLLVLDNCEHVLDAAAALAEALLRRCPDLRILATSREPFGIGAEAFLRVPPLSVPDPDLRSSGRGSAGGDAVALFAERASAAVPEFGLTEDNQVAVARICQRLDGLPLPIELAAGRMRAMSAEQILDRLNDRYSLLTGGSRGAPTRQQTLRLCIDWSHELCTEPERMLWRRMSVFTGGFELDAAEGICAGDLSPDDLLDVVAALVDRSILIREEAGAVVRYRLLETLRAYGREKLQESGEYASMRRRHRDWYEQLALGVEAEWIGPRQLESIARLGREQPNMREAMEFCLTEPGEAEAGLRIANALYLFWLARGLLGEGRHWLDLVLDRQGRQPTTERARALYADSVLAGNQGDIVAGAALIEQAREVAETLDDAAVRALVTQGVGQLAICSGDLRLAVDSFEEVLDTFRADKNTLLQIATLLGLALAFGLLGDAPRAVAYQEEALALAESRGESVYRAYSLCTLGLALWQSDPRRAAGLLERGLRLSRAVDDVLGSAICVEALAWVAAGDRLARRAAVLFGIANSLWRAVGSAGVVIPPLHAYHEESERQVRSALAKRAYEAAFERGANLSFDDGIAYALDEQLQGAPTTGVASALTRRERQVADLVAQGLTNRAIAEQLVIAPRTVEGHVEHVLAKMGFTSRAQIAAWVVEQAQVGTQPL